MRLQRGGCGGVSSEGGGDHLRALRGEGGRTRREKGEQSGSGTSGFAFVRVLELFRLDVYA
jgi:hypothetical protein